MRVVFGTNILVAAIVFPGGAGEKALLRVIEGQDQLSLSQEILDELLGVLARKFGRDREQLARVAVFLSEVAEFVKPRGRVNVLADAPDNRVLECALASHADCIVTGDKAMLALGEFGGIRIESLAAFLRKE